MTSITNLGFVAGFVILGTIIIGRRGIDIGAVRSKGSSLVNATSGQSGIELVKASAYQQIFKYLSKNHETTRRELEPIFKEHDEVYYDYVFTNYNSFILMVHGYFYKTKILSIQHISIICPENCCLDRFKLRKLQLAFKIKFNI